MVNDQFDDQYEPTVFDEEKIFYEVSEDGSYNLSKTETKTSRVLRFVLKSFIIQALAPYRDQHYTSTVRRRIQLNVELCIVKVNRKGRTNTTGLLHNLKILFRCFILAHIDHKLGTFYYLHQHSQNCT